MGVNVKDIVGAGETGKELIKQAGELAQVPINNLINPSTKTVGQRISDVFDLIFTPVEIAKIYKDHSIDKFKNKLEKKISKIPEKNRITPPLNVVGPALEAAKYYIEDELPREMFANLIARAMNSDTTKLAHPAFIEVIKQLSPLDAVIFASFKKKGSFPVASYFLNGTKVPLVSNIVLFPNISSEDIYAISISVNNLIRLGLLFADYDRQTGNYDIFNDRVIKWKIISDKYSKQRIALNDLSDDSVYFTKGMLRRTNYGRLFVDICL